MNPEVKSLWLEALTSGKFKQGKGYLRRIAETALGKDKTDYKDSDNRYCCLGVLTELYRTKTGEGRWERHETGGAYDFVLFGRTEDQMPQYTINEWAGVPGGSVIVLDEDDAKKYNKGEPEFYLADANDKGRRFKTIAKLIEKYL